MISFFRRIGFLRFILIAPFFTFQPSLILAQQADEAPVIGQIDAAVRARLAAIKRYTVTEHYTLYRGQDETHPAAEMTVETTYTAESGKSYKILAESASSLIRSFVFNPLLENEKKINLPSNRPGTWITSANYEMKLRPGQVQINGRDCFALTLRPRRKEPFLIDGTLWVSVKDGAIVQLQGVSSKSPSAWTGPTQMFRQYETIDGLAQATHARAVSESPLLGRSVITIDYEDYHLELNAPEGRSTSP